MRPAIPVALINCPSYDPAGRAPGGVDRSRAAPSASPPYSRLEDAVDAALTLAGYAPKRGERVLVKPNLLRADALTCTDPRVVRAACAWLLDRGVRVRVGDSPGFGTAPGVSRSIGLSDALKELRDEFGNSVRIDPEGLGAPVSRQAPSLGVVRIGRLALEADSLLSVPRLKAHTQMGVTCAVKNLFGCVSGIHKGVAHARHGDKGEGGDDLPRYIVALTRLLPPQAALVDAITAMHVRGPSYGSPCRLGLLAASTSCPAADTALYTLLGLDPERLPLWRALREAGMPGAFAQETTLCGAEADRFDFASFLMPERLSPQSFNPWRLCVSTLRRLWAGVRDS